MTDVKGIIWLQEFVAALEDARDESKDSKDYPDAYIVLAAKAATARYILDKIMGDPS